MAPGIRIRDKIMSETLNENEQKADHFCGSSLFVKGVNVLPNFTVNSPRQPDEIALLVGARTLPLRVVMNAAERDMNSARTIMAGWAIQTLEVTNVDTMKLQIVRWQKGKNYFEQNEPD